LREPEYGEGHVVRRVRQNGEIKWQGSTVYIGATLIGEPIRLTEDGAQGAWNAFYSSIALGVMMARMPRWCISRSIRPRLTPRPC
jgi:putative transposase